MGGRTLKKKIGAPAKALRFEATDTGCHVCVSHRLNKDGYFRYTWYVGEGKPRLAEFFHRTVWQHANGAIPDGHEIDHMCNNRACCNILHLRCLPRLEHLVHTNKNRYKTRHDDAKKYWLNHKPTGTALAAVFDVTFSTACRWIRDWKLEIKEME